MYIFLFLFTVDMFQKIIIKTTKNMFSVTLQLKG